jgi:hypothetical protein
MNSQQRPGTSAIIVAAFVGGGVGFALAMLVITAQDISGGAAWAVRFLSVVIGMFLGVVALFAIVLGYKVLVGYVRSLSRKQRKKE